jgi:hypothetical protein
VQLKQLLAALLLVVAAGVLTSGAEASKRARPISAAGAARSWVGYSTDGLYFLRLVLRADESGELGYGFVDQPPKVIALKRWWLREDELSIELDRTKEESLSRSRMSGTFGSRQLAFVVRGDDWRIEAKLFSENSFEEQLERLRSIMGEPQGDRQ